MPEQENKGRVSSPLLLNPGWEGWGGLWMVYEEQQLNLLEERTDVVWYGEWQGRENGLWSLAWIVPSFPKRKHFCVRVPSS